MKILKYLSILLVAVLSLFILYHGPIYVYRVLVWQDSDYDDFERFSTVPILRSDEQFNFFDGTAEQKSQVKLDFESHALITDLDEFHKEQLTYAFIVIQKDTIRYERYYNENVRESLQTSFSTAKSVLSLLVGKAIQEGKINSINDPITNYLPELTVRDDRFEQISIKDLLSMKSGLKFEKGVSFPFVNSDEPLTYSHPDLRYVALEKTTITHEPNSKFKYNDYNALLVGLILERALGQSVSSYLEQEIWQKIGMEFNASWITDEKDFEQMQSGLNARPIDFAKIGKLVLQDGMWNNVQIIDSAWIALSTTPMDTITFRSGQQWAYSLFWWNVIRPEATDDIFACGHMGQFIYVAPSSKTIIIRHGLEPGSLDDDDWTDIFSHYVYLQ